MARARLYHVNRRVFTRSCVLSRGDRLWQVSRRVTRYVTVRSGRRVRVAPGPNLRQQRRHRGHGRVIMMCRSA